LAAKRYGGRLVTFSAPSGSNPQQPDGIAARLLVIKEEMMRLRFATLLACASVLGVGMPGLAGQERAPYSAIVVFGTSLSDAGNAFALRGGTNTPPNYQLDPLLIPGAPYARGGHHFSNGATWVEQLARSLRLAGSVRPAFGSDSPQATNYAVGAARAYDDGQNFNLSNQVQAFLSDHPGGAPSDALYVIEMGGNDIRDAIVAYQTGGPAAAQTVLQNAIASIANHILLLHQAGARQFLVWLPPNVGLTPAIRRLDQMSPGAAQLAAGLSQAFNANLSTVLTQLSGLPGISIARFDASALLNGIVADPAGYGLTNTDQACVVPYDEPFFCQAPDEYLFWDGIHPTRAAHTIVAQAVAFVLGW
jgi:outer membrane lipase/esterase